MFWGIFVAKKVPQEVISAKGGLNPRIWLQWKMLPPSTLLPSYFLLIFPDPLQALDHLSEIPGHKGTSLSEPGVPCLATGSRSSTSPVLEQGPQQTRCSASGTRSWHCVPWITGWERKSFLSSLPKHWLHQGVTRTSQSPCRSERAGPQAQKLVCTEVYAYHLVALFCFLLYLFLSYRLTMASDPGFSFEEWGEVSFLKEIYSRTQY